MGPEAKDVHESANSTKGIAVEQAATEGTDDKTKTSRHPRWTRQETLVLIEGKKVAENRGRNGHKCCSVFGSDRVEPKWETVSSYCREHGVNRGPVQCRKRWSNLIGDFKKIRIWESKVQEEAESFWMMRNDLRKQKKLPGFFDREVYNILDGKAFVAAAFPLTIVAVMADSKEDDRVEATVAEDEEREEEGGAEAVFYSGRPATTEDGLFSDFEQLEQEEIGRSPEKETILGESPTKTVTAPVPISGTIKEKQTGLNFGRGSVSHNELKRRRLSLDGCRDTNLDDRLAEVLQRSSNMLNAQLEAHNINCELDRDQRGDHNGTLLATLSKITDALVRIADKL